MFVDRNDVGRRLAAALKKFSDSSDTIVVALPRGGVIPAKIIADSLRLPLEVVMVKKIGHPLNPECAIGAVSLNSQVIDPDQNIAADFISSETTRLRRLLAERYSYYYGSKDPVDYSGKSVILVDDGIATGSTMFAAIKLMREGGVRNVIVAIPIAPKDTLLQLSKMVDEVICLETPDPFYAIGEHYENFDQVSDDEVVELLRSS